MYSRVPHLKTNIIKQSDCDNKSHAYCCKRLVYANVWFMQQVLTQSTIKLILATVPYCFINYILNQLYAILHFTLLLTCYWAYNILCLHKELLY